MAPPALRRMLYPVNDTGTSLTALSEAQNVHRLLRDVPEDIFVEDPSSAMPQVISMVASILAAMSTITSTQLESKFPQSFHEFSASWSLIHFSIRCYFLVYVGFVVYGAMYGDYEDETLSVTLALMAAPSVPLHGFLWAATRWNKKWQAVEPPSSEEYLRQSWDRKHKFWLVLSCVPLCGAAIVACFRHEWHGMALQVASVAGFFAASYAPGFLPLARENAFGRGGRFLLVPRPGSRSDTIGFMVDLLKETLLPPVRVDMMGIPSYAEVQKRMQGQLGDSMEEDRSSQRPVMAYFSYFSSMVEKYPSEKMSEMTNQLWRTLESSKKEALAGDIHSVALMYSLCERMAYVAFRPGSLDDRQIACSMSFVICQSDLELPPNEPRHQAADALMKEWHALGIQLLNSQSWIKAHASAGVTNPVDIPVPAASDILGDLSDPSKRHTVEGLGAALYFMNHMFGHLGPTLMTQIEDALPYYHNRIKNDMLRIGSLPIICCGTLTSMNWNSFIGKIDGNQWGSGGKPLTWGGGGYALLDQSYARNAALAYVAQLAIIVVKAVLSG